MSHSRSGHDPDDAELLRSFEATLASARARRYFVLPDRLLPAETRLRSSK